MSVVVGTCGVVCVLTVPLPPVLAYYKSKVFDDRPGAVEV